MYLYIFENGKFANEVFSNKKDIGTISSLMWELKQKNFGQNIEVQIVLSSRRFMTPKLTDEGVKEE